MTDVGDFRLSATARLRTNFAVHHLRAAAEAARRAYEVEQANVSEEFGSWFEGMILWVPVSVVMAGAALEAGANEVVQDILDGFTGLSLTDGRKALLTDLKKEQSGNAVSKYRQIALLFDKLPARGSIPWQNADLLVKFRNNFMHFKPSWSNVDDVRVRDSDLIRDLKTKIPIVAAYQRRFVFPFGFMTYGCARWAVQTVLEFSIDFTKLLDIKDTFVFPSFDFSLPPQR